MQENATRNEDGLTETLVWIGLKCL